MPTKSDASVWRLTAADPPQTRYLKIADAADGGATDELGREADVLGWLAGRVHAPTVLDVGCDEARCWMLTAAAPGLAAHAPEHRFGSIEPLVEALGRGLRAVHGLATTGCLFTASLDDLLARAEQRVASGRVDPADFETLHQRYTPAELFERLVTMRPPADHLAEPVVTHGDFTLDNVLVVPGTGELSGILDWGRAGVGDPYRDLAVGARSLAHHLGPELGYRFFDAYGLAHPGPRLLDFYLLLDEFS